MGKGVKEGRLEYRLFLYGLNKTCLRRPGGVGGTSGISIVPLRIEQEIFEKSNFLISLVVVDKLQEYSWGRSSQVCKSKARFGTVLTCGHS